MKLLFKTAPVLAGIALCTMLLVSCTKESVQSSSASSLAPASLSSRFINNDEVTVTEDSGFQKLVIHPGPNNGNDVYVDKNDGVPSGNQNYVPELPVNSWIYNGHITTRSYIKFDQLKYLPDTLHIVSAQLYLYTAERFLNHPQGNTGDNRCAVMRVVGRNWKETGVTWNAQPDATTEGEAIIPASDQATQQFNYNPVIDVTAMVQDMIAHPATNYGFKFQLLKEMPYAAINFASSETKSASSRPKLVIYF